MGFFATGRTTGSAKALSDISFTSCGVKKHRFGITVTHCTSYIAPLGKHNSEEKNNWNFHQDWDRLQNPQNRQRRGGPWWGSLGFFNVFLGQHQTRSTVTSDWESWTFLN